MAKVAERSDTIAAAAFARANERGAALQARGSAVSARYFSTGRRLSIRLATGATLLVPVDQVQGLAGATDADLRHVLLNPGGRGLRFPRLDADVSVLGLLDGVFGSPRWMAEEDRRGSAADQAGSVEIRAQRLAAVLRNPHATGEEIVAALTTANGLNNREGSVPDSVARVLRAFLSGQAVDAAVAEAAERAPQITHGEARPPKGGQGDAPRPQMRTRNIRMPGSGRIVRVRKND